MQRENVQSPDMRSVGYSQISGVLEIEFRTGTTYQYYQVPQLIHGKLMESKSKGRFHRRHIQHRFRNLKVEE